MFTDRQIKLTKLAFKTREKELEKVIQDNYQYPNIKEACKLVIVEQNQIIQKMERK